MPHRQTPSVDRLYARIIDRVGASLRFEHFDPRAALAAGPGFDPHALTDRTAYYGVSPHYPVHLDFTRSALSGSYFLGRCEVSRSLVLRSDVRGDELKNCECCYDSGMWAIPLHSDESISVEDSLLVKTLVHCHCHDPAFPEAFRIQNTASMAYANIHGSPMHGAWLAPFATVDLTTVHDCVFGAYCYVQTGELSHTTIEPGRVLIRTPEFSFDFHHRPERLAEYVGDADPLATTGKLGELAARFAPLVDDLFEGLHAERHSHITTGVSRYAVIAGAVRFGHNVLVAQRAYVQDATLGDGANVQENCIVVQSTLRGFDVLAHGARILGADVGRDVFVGFNALVRGTPAAPVVVGDGCIVMPHTIIDADEPLSIEPGHVVWGVIRSQADLTERSVLVTDLENVTERFERGRMVFTGSGRAFVRAMRLRVEHILTENGAYYDGETGAGHAQQSREISFNAVQPYPLSRSNELAGLFPTISIRP